MKEALDPSVDYKALVREGYDRCASLYNAARRGDDGRQLEPLLEVLPAGSSVLDLGCGAGVPIAAKLASLHSVTGVDASGEMLALASAAVTNAAFVQGDMLEVEFKPESFDAVVAVFTLFHLPREEHSMVFSRVASWLRPAGYFLATLSEEAEGPYTEEDFFGTEMYWSNFGHRDYEQMLHEYGFEILHNRIIGHGYGKNREIRDERHPMVLARKPEGWIC